MKRTGIMIALGLCGFGLGTALAWMLDWGSPATTTEPSALRHITQFRPTPETPGQGDVTGPAAEKPLSGR